MYELILIDADETLFDYTKAERYALKKALEKQGITDNFETVLTSYQSINLNLWKMLEKGEITKEEIRTKRFYQLRERYSFNYHVETISNDYLKALGESPFLIQGAEPLCQYLHNKYQVVIVSNGIREVQESRLKKSVLKPYIDGLITSEEAKVNKPNPKIFEYTLEKIGHKSKDKILMIGDALTADIKGGINFGIHTCWYNPKKQKNLTDIQPTFEVHHLEEIMNLV